ncbi:MAG: hypothetical protein CL662_00820 [Bacteroidetes bacterium]|nr:hypothetical protein [Bacteroidota bacterium]|tara:strand:- start:530 stop:784 length:255 start_codon:yes stop_codon:yes gene_type:complete
MIQSDKGIEDIIIYWAHCFDVIKNEEVYDHQMSLYIKELHYTDKQAAEFLSILCAIPNPWEAVQSYSQLSLTLESPRKNEKIRI